jgi:hypothetical protein
MSTEATPAAALVPSGTPAPLPSGTAAPGTEPKLTPGLIADIIAKTERTLALRPVDGSLTEKIAAFREMSQHFAQLALNGWDTIQKCSAACWLADGLAMHPALYMQNNWVAPFKGGKIVVMPQWPFMLALLRSRVPKFNFRFVHDDAEKCAVWMTNGTYEHTETYTMDDAKRQGLLGRDNAWTSGNVREMMRAKVIRRAANVIAPEALMGLAAGGDGSEDEGERRPEVTQEQVDQAAEIAVSALEKATTAPDWREALRTEIRARAKGAVTGRKMLEFANLVRLEMKLPKYSHPDEITPDNARGMVEYLRANYPNLASPQAPAAATEATTEGGGGKDAAPEPPTEPVAEDEVPLPMDEDAPAAPPERESEDDGKVETLMKLAAAAKKARPSAVFVKEAPAKSGRWYFSHGETVKSLGLESAIWLKDEMGTQKIPADLCRRVCKALRLIVV